MHAIIATSDGSVRPKGKRYRLTAAGKLDRRTRPALRQKAFEAIYRTQVGGKLTKFQQAMVKRCASLAVFAEVIQASILSGECRNAGRPYTAEDLYRINASLRKAEIDLRASRLDFDRLPRKPAKPHGGMSLLEALAIADSLPRRPRPEPEKAAPADAPARPKRCLPRN